jgi:hypothetical protein
MTTTAPADDFSIETEFADNVGKQHYHCSSEWHLARQRPVCLPIYLLALHLSKESKSFCASAEGMADYFDYDEKHIRRGLDSLQALGFLRVLTKKRYRPTVFRVLTHKQWAEKFPGQCVKKAERPWSGEGDKLLQLLSARTGQKVQWMEFQAKKLRRFDLSDGEIINLFDQYMNGDGKLKKDQNVARDFNMWLDKKLKATPKL